MQLILGTAEFGPKPYGEGVATPPDRKEIHRILNLAWEAGIRTLDCAEAYEVDENLIIGFEQIYKTRNLNPGEWYHYKPGEAPVATKQASVYDLPQLGGLDRAIIPYNIDNAAFAGVTLPHITYIRSVFDRGRLLQKGYTVKDCLTFVKRLKPQGVIVGVNSVKELEEILLAWGKV